jgi:hypothetical protein
MIAVPARHMKNPNPNLREGLTVKVLTLEIDSF